MKCPNCFTENKNSRFCVTCGEPLTSTASVGQKFKPKQSIQSTWTRPDPNNEPTGMEDSPIEEEEITEEVDPTPSTFAFLLNTWKTPSKIFSEKNPPKNIGGWILGLYCLLFGLVFYIFSLDYHQLFFEDAIIELIIFPGIALFLLFIVAAIILLLFPSEDQKINFPATLNYIGWTFLYPTAFMVVACILAIFQTPIALVVVAISLLLGFGFLGGALFLLKRKIDPFLHLILLFLSIGLSGYFLQSLWLDPISSFLENPFLFK